MLEAIRKHSKSWFFRAFLIIIALSFAVWGVGDMVGGRVNDRPAIRVGEVEIRGQEVTAEFQREIQRLQPLFGGQLNAEQARQLGLLDRVIDQLVTGALIDQAARDLNMVADVDALRREIAGTPAFQNQLGQFDPNLYRQTLFSAGFTEERYETLVRRDMLRTQLMEAVTGAGDVPAPGMLADPLYSFRAEQRVAQVMTVPAESFPAPEDPGDDVLRARFEEQAERWMAPEYRQVTAVVVQAGDVAEEVVVSEEEIEAAYQQRLAEFGSPERRNVQQILLDSAEEAERARAMIEEGSDLQQIAAEAAPQPVDIIELGWMSRDDTLPQLADVIFGLEEGQISQPVQTPLGWHVLRVSAIDAGTTRPLDEVRDQIVQDIQAERAADLLYDAANRLDDALAGGATLEEVAEGQNLRLVQIPAVDIAGHDPEGDVPPDMPRDRRFLETAFSTPQGMESQTVEYEDRRGFFVLRVDGVTPPARRPFEQVREEILVEWQGERRQELAAERAEEIAGRLREGQQPEALAEEFGLTSRTSDPFTRQESTEDLSPPVINQLFQAQPGEVVTGSYENGAVVARLAEIQPADPAANPDEIEGLREQLRQAQASDMFEQFLTALRSRYDVQINPQQIRIDN
ncbi:SurA N-terminal domain-containing protein [Telmatospirillum sp. J64-1]|uniref:SurA N-terminal domain-containing protein n=1 Tax=Telmatospirillum sp. J64-1 TaxID=2502183 RepID=UPI00163DE2D3|nr:SurA N-terminal domain-containing protein [Telmatospirillum sp. J64-1]